MKRRYQPQTVWLVIMGLGALISLAAALATHGQALVDSLYGKGRGYLMDYFSHIAYVDDPAHVYESSLSACFPPLAYCLYALLRGVSTVVAQGAPLYHTALRADYPSLLVYTVYVCMLTGGAWLLIQRYLREKHTATVALTAALILMSNVFVAGLLERGNSAYIVLVLLLGAFLLMDGNRAWKRETALVLIALAAGLKLYPAVFGLLYLRNRRWAEAGRLVLYGLVCFFAPFAFFGGLESLPLLLNNQQAVQFSDVNGWSITYIAKVLCIKLGTGTEVATVVAYVAAVAFAVACLWGVFRAKIGWQSVALLIAVFVALPQANGFYIHCYWLIPMLGLFSGKHEHARAGWDTLYAVLFALILIPMCAFTYAQSERFTAGASYLLTAFILADIYRQRRATGALRAETVLRGEAFGTAAL